MQHLAQPVPQQFEVVLIVLVGIILFDGEPGCNLSYKRAISSTILLISWSIFYFSSHNGKKISEKLKGNLAVCELDLAFSDWSFCEGGK